MRYLMDIYMIIVALNEKENVGCQTGITLKAQP